MNPYRIVTTLAKILSLLIFFTLLGQRFAFCFTNMMVNALFYDKWQVDFQNPWVGPVQKHVENKENGVYTSFFNNTNNFHPNYEFSSILKKRCVLSGLIRYSGSSQRPPPPFLAR